MITVRSDSGPDSSGGYASSVKQSLADLFTSGKVNLDDFNDVEFRDFDRDFKKARGRLKKE